MHAAVGSFAAFSRPRARATSRRGAVRGVASRSAPVVVVRAGADPDGDPATSPRTYRVVARSASRRRPPSRSPPPRPPRAAYETQTAPSSAASAPSAPASNDLTLYKRSFRERFETSISGGTHDYSFKYPKDTWKPDIVSLNDGKLYGVDLRFSSPGEGKLCTHVLPFVGDESLKDVGPPEAALDRFVELIGAFWNENGFGVPGGNAGTLEHQGGGQGRRDVLRVRDGETP